MRPFDDFLAREEVALVSCCNVGHGGSRYSVAVITAQGIDWLDLDAVIDPSQDKGVTGMAATAEHCFLALPGEPERLVSLDTSLRPVDVFECEQARDLHSLAIYAERLYFASTGCNQVLSIGCRNGRFTGPERVHVTNATPSADETHLNSLLIGNDQPMLYSMFGVGPRSPVRTTGAVVEAYSGRTVVAGLMDPHTLTRLDDGRIAFCESMRSALCVLEPGRGELKRITLRGYTRGIAQLSRHLMVSASHWRSRSRSSREVRDMPDMLPAGTQQHGAQSHLFVLRSDLRLAHTIDFTAYAAEVYDIAFLGRDFRPASVFKQAAERRRLAQKYAWPRSLMRSMRGGSLYSAGVRDSL